MPTDILETPAPPIKAKTTKILPSVLRCDRPYSICYSGAMTCATPEDAKLAHHFALAWQETASRLTVLFQEMLGNKDEEILLYLLILPSLFPDWVSNHPLLDALNAATDIPLKEGEKDARWVKQADDCAYQLLRAMISNEEHRAGTPYRAVLDRLGLKSSVVTKERFEAIYSLFPGEMERHGVTSGVAGAFKSFLTNRERYLVENQKKLARRAELQEKHGAFFSAFDLYSRHVTAWAHCSAIFKDVRTKLQAEAVEYHIINACQALVAHEHPEVECWKDIFFSATSRELAEANPQVLQVFRDSFPAIVPPPRDQESYLYRRFGRKAPLTKLADDAHHLMRVLIMYRDSEGLFADETEVNRLIHWIEGRRPQKHMGWLEICKDKKTPSLKALKEFLRGPVRDWISCNRPIKDAEMGETVDSWPLFKEGRRGWEMIDHPVDFRGVDGVGKLRGNEIALRLTVPRFTSPIDPELVVGKKVDLTVTVCGNLKRLSKAKRMEAQLDVANGMIQFRPGRKLEKHRGREAFHTYLKEQGMRLILRDGKLRGEISATEMTESAGDPTVTKEFRKNVREGERVAVVHYLPGGDRLLSLMIFQKDPTVPAGWREITIREQIHRTDRDRGKCNVAMKSHQVLSIQNSSLIYHLTTHEQRRLESVDVSDPEKNAESIAAFGPARTQMGRTYYKQIAASLGKICSDHHVAYCLVAVASRGLVARNMRAPVANFFQFSQALGAGGSLVMALQKNGVRLLPITSGSYGQVDVRRFAASGNIADFDWGISYHVESKEGKEGKKTLCRYGRRDHLLCREGNASREYPRNACWASLIAAFNPDAAKEMDKLLEKLEQDPEPIDVRWAEFTEPNGKSQG